MADLVFIGAMWIALLVSSISIYKGVQILVRRTRYRSSVLEVVPEVYEKKPKVRRSDELVEEEPDEESEDVLEEEVKKPKKEQKIKAAKPPKRKSGKVVREEPPSKPVEKRPAKKVGKISPNKYPECFGTDYIFQNCKRNCGVAEECERAIKILGSAIS